MKEVQQFIQNFAGNIESAKNINDFFYSKHTVIAANVSHPMLTQCSLSGT